MKRKFYCATCDNSFWETVAENVAEEYLARACPLCGVAVGLYQLAGPLTNKRIQDWGLQEWALAGLVAFVGYQGVKALRTLSA